MRGRRTWPGPPLRTGSQARIRPAQGAAGVKSYPARWSLGRAWCWVLAAAYFFSRLGSPVSPLTLTFYPLPSCSPHPPTRNQHFPLSSLVSVPLRTRGPQAHTVAPGSRTFSVPGQFLRGRTSRQASRVCVQIPGTQNKVLIHFFFLPQAGILGDYLCKRLPGFGGVRKKKI